MNSTDTSANTTNKRNKLGSRERTLLHSMLGEIGWTALAVASAWFANSIALWANASRVGLEMMLCVLAFFGALKLAQTQRNTGFDYGLGKLEHLFSLLGGVVVLITFLILGWLTIDRLQNPTPTEGALFGITVLIVATLFNGWFYQRFRRLLQQEHSPILFTQSAIYRNAALASVISLLAVLLPTLFSGQAWLYYADPIGAIILCGFLAHTGVTLIKDSLFQLLDGTLEESMQMDIIQALTRHFDDYSQLHGVRSRRSGAQVFVEIFLEFAKDQPHGEVLDAAAMIKADLEERLPSAVVWIVPVNQTMMRSE